MLVFVTFLVLFSNFSRNISSHRTCVPNSQFKVNGLLCFCDRTGRWLKENCKILERHQNCQRGQVVWQGCSKCICQEDSTLFCTNLTCYEDASLQQAIKHHLKGLNALGPSCTPFRSYYVDCNICVCTASGRTVDAHCVKDTSCSLEHPPTYDILVSSKKYVCLPKVTYLFPCLHCLCSDEGFVVLDTCIETCQQPNQDYFNRQKCIPRTLYRKACNLCICPDDSVPNDNLCTRTHCSAPLKLNTLSQLLSKTDKCSPYSFTGMRCVYCDCNAEGTINKKSCLEQECIKTIFVEHGIARHTCDPGEIVPICTECFCLRSGSTNETYCSRSCSTQSKLDVIEKVLKNGLKDYRLIDYAEIKMVTSEQCDPNTIYVNQGRLCLCPKNGKANYELCSSTKGTRPPLPEESFPVILKNNPVNIDIDLLCEPSTFVEFDCNTCFCSKKGKIDPKWCTYDDCDAKTIIQDTHRTSGAATTFTELSGTCTPGSISKVDCNFCICSDSGRLKDIACTKNHCSGLDQNMTYDKFSCEPLAYYEVDCNVCFCPRDGLKNVTKCTKNLCEKYLLRSEVCVPGQLFSDECNVCVCPPNGNKADKACTNYTCPDATAARKTIFILSETLLGNEVNENITRNLDLCFPGEEFIVGCQLCVCPDIGLRAYATCTTMLCDESEQSSQMEPNAAHISGDRKKKSKRESLPDFRRTKDKKNCLVINLSDSSERMSCTAGSMYIIKCMQCICPYMGNINNFCRPLPPGTYCEEAYPGFNFLPMARRNLPNVTSPNITQVSTAKPRKQVQIVNHDHTVFRCEKVGRIIDECYICDCEENNDEKFVIEEHCFKSDNKLCENAKPSFLNHTNKVVDL